MSLGIIYMYPKVDHSTDYERITVELCAVAEVDYHGFYRTETISNYSFLIRLTMSNIFAQYIYDILAKFETRYPNI
jgi:hypothetical protein